jgi:hypothetical protein
MVPRTITLRTSTGYNCDIRLKDVNRKVVMDQHGLGFSIDYHTRIGYFLTFKKIKPVDFRFIIFDYSCSEMVKK